MSRPGSSDSTAGRGVPRVTLTIVEAAAALGISESSFRTLVLPDLRVVHAGPRLKLVRIVELDRWAERREAVGGY
jgi:hypothetical protein